MIVDAHTHIVGRGHWAPAWWDWVANDWASKEPGRRPEMVRDRIEANLVDDGSRMVEHMDEAGVDAVVDLPIDFGPEHRDQATVDAQQQHALACAERFPGRIIPFAGIDPRRQAPSEQLKRWIDRGARGLKLYPPVGYRPDHPGALGMYEVCLEHDLPVLFHTGEQFLPVLDGAFESPELLLPVVQAYPDLKVWIGHSGALESWDQALRVAKASNAACLELSVWVWRDAAAADERRLVEHIVEGREAVGIERLLFGTDHVSGAKERGAGFMSDIVARFRRLPEIAHSVGHSITSDEVDLIMGANAARELRLDRA